MSTVLCANERCTFNHSNFCVKDFVSLNSIAECMEFYNKKGLAYMVPLYEMQHTAEETEESGKDPD